MHLNFFVFPHPVHFLYIRSEALHHSSHLPYHQEEMDVVLVSVLVDKQHKCFMYFGHFDLLETLISWRGYWKN